MHLWSGEEPNALVVDGEPEPIWALCSFVVDGTVYSSIARYQIGAPITASDVRLVHATQRLPRCPTLYGHGGLLAAADRWRGDSQRDRLRWSFCRSPTDCVIAERNHLKIEYSRAVPAAEVEAAEKLVKVVWRAAAVDEPPRVIPVHQRPPFSLRLEREKTRTWALHPAQTARALSTLLPAHRACGSSSPLRGGGPRLRGMVAETVVPLGS